MPRAIIGFSERSGAPHGCVARCLCLGLVAVLSALMPLAASSAAAPKRVVLVTIDTLRADHVAPYGDLLQTPAFANGA